MIYAFFAMFKEEDSDLYNGLEGTFEILFCIDMITRFFLEYTPKDSVYPVRDIMIISVTYLKT